MNKIGKLFFIEPNSPYKDLLVLRPTKDSGGKKNFVECYFSIRTPNLIFLVVSLEVFYRKYTGDQYIWTQTSEQGADELKYLIPRCLEVGTNNFWLIFQSSDDNEWYNVNNFIPVPDV